MIRPSVWARTFVCAASCLALAFFIGGCEDPHSAEGTISTSGKARESFGINKEAAEAPPSPYGSKGKLLGPKGGAAPSTPPKEETPKE